MEKLLNNFCMGLFCFCFFPPLVTITRNRMPSEHFKRKLWTRILMSSTLK